MEYYQYCFIYCQRATSSRLTKTVKTARLGREFVSVFLGLHDLSLSSCMFCFTLDS